MTDLDEIVSEGLRRATDEVDGIDAAELAQRLASRRVEPSAARGPSRRRWWIAAAAALVAVLVGGVLVRAGVEERRSQDLVADDPIVPAPSTTTSAPVDPGPAAVLPAPLSPVEEWAPGWYQIDTASLPVEGVASVWFRGDLYVTAASDGADIGTTRVFRRDQRSGVWSELPPLDLMLASLVAAGDRLVAVGEEGYAAPPIPRAWAVLSEDGTAWEPMGRTRPEPTLASGRYLGPRLVWTGERVLDTTGAAVLDPETGAATGLEVPDEEALVTTFGATVWTGERAVLATWGPETGLAWDARGRLLGELPAAAPETLPEIPEGEQPLRANVSAADGSVLAVAVASWSPTAWARRLPAEADRWQDAPAPPVAPLVGQLSFFTPCRPWTASTASTVLALTCDGASLLDGSAVDDGWQSVGRPELLERAEVVSVSDSDRSVTIWLSVPPPPDQFAAATGAALVWVPEE